MPLYTSDALILRTYKLGESDRIVVFLTRDRGKKRGVAKNARQSRRRFGGALEPMTSGRVAYFERARRDLVSLNYVEPIRSPLAARGEGVSGVGPNQYAVRVDRRRGVRRRAAGAGAGASRADRAASRKGAPVGAGLTGDAPVIEALRDTERFCHRDTERQSRSARR